MPAFHRALETLMLGLAVLLGAYTGFLLSAPEILPFLNNPGHHRGTIPDAQDFRGAAVARPDRHGVYAIVTTTHTHSTEGAHYLHRIGSVVWLEIFLLAAFFVGLALSDVGKMRAGGGAGRQILELVVLAWRRRAGIDYPAAAETGQIVASRFTACWPFAAPV